MTTPATALPAGAETPQPRLTIRAITAIVANEYGVPLSAINGRSQTAKMVEPRQVAMWLAGHHLGASLSTIGRVIGDRDHTTVLSGQRKIEARRKDLPELAERIDRIVTRIGEAEAEAQARRAALVRVPEPAPEPVPSPPVEEPAEPPARDVVIVGATHEEVRVLDALAAYLRARDQAVAHQHTVGEAAARRRADEAYRALREVHGEMLFAKREAKS